jgi:hypothetical protein
MRDEMASLNEAAMKIVNEGERMLEYMPIDLELLEAVRVTKQERDSRRARRVKMAKNEEKKRTQMEWDRMPWDARVGRNIHENYAKVRKMMVAIWRFFKTVLRKAKAFRQDIKPAYLTINVTPQGEEEEKKRKKEKDEDHEDHVVADMKPPPLNQLWLAKIYGHMGFAAYTGYVQESFFKYQPKNVTGPGGLRLYTCQRQHSMSRRDGVVGRNLRTWEAIAGLKSYHPLRNPEYAIFLKHSALEKLFTRVALVEEVPDIIAMEIKDCCYEKHGRFCVSDMIPYRPQKLTPYNQFKIAVIEAMSLHGIRDSNYTAALKKRIEVSQKVKRRSSIVGTDDKYAVQDKLGNKANAALGTNFKGGLVSGGLRPGRGPYLMLDGSDLRRLGNAITEEMHTPSAGQALLRITVISARDLLAMDAGGTSDPYCELNTEPGRIKDNNKKTATQMKTLNPYWNHTFELDVTGLTGMGTVHLRMMDYDWGSSDDLIGTLDLKIVHLTNGKLKQKWYPLQGPPLKKPLTGFKHAGEVELRTQLLMGEAPEDKSDELHEPGIGETRLRVKICQGKSMLAADKNGLSDPYVVLRVGVPGEPAMKRRTDIRYKTLEPVFNHTFEFDVSMLFVGDLGSQYKLKKAALRLAVFDHDMGSADDFMGQLAIPLTDLNHNPGLPLRTWYSLKNEKNVVDAANGKIRSALSCVVPSPPNQSKLNTNELHHNVNLIFLSSCSAPLLLHLTTAFAPAPSGFLYTGLIEIETTFLQGATPEAAAIQAAGGMKAYIQAQHMSGMMVNANDDLTPLEMKKSKEANSKRLRELKEAKIVVKEQENEDKKRVLAERDAKQAERDKAMEVVIMQKRAAEANRRLKEAHEQYFRDDKKKKKDGKSKGGEPMRRADRIAKELAEAGVVLGPNPFNNA